VNQKKKKKPQKFKKRMGSANRIDPVTGVVLKPLTRFLTLEAKYRKEVSTRDPPGRKRIKHPAPGPL